MRKGSSVPVQFADESGSTMVQLVTCVCVVQLVTFVCNACEKLMHRA